MTGTRDASEVITQALSVIDESLAQVQHRELVSSTEISDLLLDLRLLLMSAAEPVAPAPVASA